MSIPSFGVGDNPAYKISAVGVGVWWVVERATGRAVFAWDAADLERLPVKFPSAAGAVLPDKPIIDLETGEKVASDGWHEWARELLSEPEPLPEAVAVQDRADDERHAGGGLFLKEAPPACGAVDPPIGNTGVHRSRGSLVGTLVNADWLTLTYHGDLAAVQRALETVGLGALDQREGGTRFTQQLHVGLHGLTVTAVPRDERQNWCGVNLPGECCHWLGAAGVKRLMEEFWFLHMETGAKLNCTRFDVAADTQAFKAEWFARMAERDDKALQAGRPERDIERRSDAFHVERSEGGGCTIYLGSEKSDKRWCVYHKLDGDTFGAGVAFTRVEQRFYGAAANACYEMYRTTPLDEWGDQTAKLLNDFARIEKRWWSSFVGTVERAGLVVHRARSTVAQAKRWLQRAVAPTLALVMDAENTIMPQRGRSFLEALLRDGRERRSAVGRRRVATNELEGLPSVAFYNLAGLAVSRG